MNKETKNKNILTLILIIIVAVIIGIIGYLGFELITGKVSEDNAAEITDEFDRQVPTLTAEEVAEQAAVQENSTTGTGSSGSGGSGRKRKRKWR